MRIRTAVAASAALLCAAGAMSPALAAPAGGEVKGTWTASATPNPTGNTPGGSGYCKPTGPVGRATMELKIPGPGSLEVNLNNVLDWSGDIRDKASDEVLGQADGSGGPQDKEVVSATFKKATTVILGACNLEGEPSIDVTYVFTPKKKR